MPLPNPEGFCPAAVADSVAAPPSKVLSIRDPFAVAGKDPIASSFFRGRAIQCPKDQPKLILPGWPGGTSA